ncbi:hypothetical protein [Xenorhabdus szentirmaii]|uniref:hypothetical protein n=1 Tax=Xenorhabdus szentirmaii TaxID=290112 RepID=UPI000C050C05|nr:hypothetical protein [Xenorhabdus szentirmaii]PHM40347.1 hypothetical protein Xszus_00002 [Xenorhabdus szentirmaii]
MLAALIRLGYPDDHGYGCSCPVGGHLTLMDEIALIVDIHVVHGHYPAVAGHIALTVQDEIAL